MSLTEPSNSTFTENPYTKLRYGRGRIGRRPVQIVQISKYFALAIHKIVQFSKYFALATQFRHSYAKFRHSYAQPRHSYAKFRHSYAKFRHSYAQPRHSMLNFVLKHYLL